MRIGTNDMYRLFSIGPFGDRVDFASQQSRAFSLAAALSSKYRTERSQQIAILGAGIAGLTACVALHRAGFKNLTLIEGNDRELTVHLAARHRYIHPGYSRWPMNANFAATTNFPFLNWHCGDAYEVAEQIRSQWNDFKKYEALDEDGKLVIKQEFGRTVCEVEAEGEGHRLKVWTTPTSRIQKIGARRNDTYDLVIVALGFGSENHIKDSDAGSYWLPDYFAAYREHTMEYGLNTFEISGIGDGGLIDCSRFALDYGTNGDLPIRVISNLRHTDYASMPMEWGLPPSLSEFEQSVSDIEEKAQKYGNVAEEQKRTRYLETEYTSLIKFLEQSSNPAHELLENRLKQNVLDRMRLVGSTPRPFLPRATPINKLLVGFLYAKYPDIYHDRTGHTVSEGTEDDKTTKIIRHGANPPVLDICRRFLPKGEEAKTIYNNFKNAWNNSLNPNFEQKEFYYSPGPLDEDEDLEGTDYERDETLKTRENLKYKTALARQFAKSFYGALSLDQEKTGDGVKFVIYVLSEDVSAIDYQQLGGFDRTLYGIEVKFRVRPPNGIIVGAPVGP